MSKSEEGLKKLKTPTKKAKKNNGITLFDLRLSTCRFIISEEGKPVFYCGKTTSKSSYCENHYNICYKKVTTRLL